MKPRPPPEVASLLEPLRRSLLDRFGRRGTLLLGVVVVVLFILAGGPLWVAGLSSSLVALLLFAAVLVAPAAWVLWDARQRAIERAFLWALFALCGNVVAVIVYLLVRDAAPPTLACSGCGRGLRAAHASCPWCGTARPSPGPSCPKCRAGLEAGWRFCPYCRHESQPN